MKAVEFRQFQPIALDFLHRTPRANLFAQMGAGKTLIIETLVSELRSQENTLVLAPLRVARKTWSDEAAEWEHLTGLTVAPIIGDPVQRLAALKRRAHIHTINYENVEWLLEQIPASRWPFTTVIADESTRLKSFRLKQGGRRAGALATTADRTKRWINLTGTPSPNGLLDLWGQQWFVDRGAALGRSFSSFESRWFYKPPRGSEHTKPQPFAHTQAEIEAAMRPTTMSIRAADWFHVDEPVHVEVRVELPEAARREYRRMARDLLAFLGGDPIRAVNALTKSTKLLQLASGAIYREDGSWAPAHDEKIDALRSIVNEAAGAPVLVSYSYVHELERILKAFPEARRLKTKKDEDDWNAGKIPILVAHPDSAGHGLNLQHGGNILVYFGFTWKLEAHLQILERIGPLRQMQSGYKRPVFVYSIIADNTADEAVLARNAGKASVMDALMASLRATA
jgi:SNF2 family DNA or RNA helicase